MDVFKLGIRGVLGIIAPGLPVTLAVLYVIVVACAPFCPEAFVKTLPKYELLLIVLVVLGSYMVGSTFRLNASDDLDELSSVHQLKQWSSDKKDQDEDWTADKDWTYVNELVKELMSNPSNADVGPKAPLSLLDHYGGLLWCAERFPYPIWELLKIRRYHSDDMRLHFQGCQKSMLRDYGDGSDATQPPLQLPGPKLQVGVLLRNELRAVIPWLGQKETFRAGLFYLLSSCVALFSVVSILCWIVLLIVSCRWPIVAPQSLAKIKDVHPIIHALVLGSAAIIFGLAYGRILQRFRKLGLTEGGKLEAKRKEIFGDRGKEFFNHCKMVVSGASGDVGMPAVQEAFLAEATTRFYAGMYYSLRYCIWIFFVAAIFLWTLILANVVYSGAPEFLEIFGSELHPGWLIIHAILSTSMTIVCWRASSPIMKGFRVLRLKEVDTVYDAYFIATASKEAGNPRCPLGKGEGAATRYTG